MSATCPATQSRNEDGKPWAMAAVSWYWSILDSVACIGNNLNRIARWANTHASAIDAVEIIANLVYISQTLDKLARVGREADDAR